jgi:ribosomal protein S18 acetylase RimI-like enzyme
VMRPWESKTEKLNRYYISYIAIDSLYQRKGIGKILLNLALDGAKKIGAEKVKLVHDDTQQLNNFYQTSTIYPKKSKYIGKNHRNVEEKRLTYDLQQINKTENQ